jgi:hypothetical protein
MPAGGSEEEIARVIFDLPSPKGGGELYPWQWRKEMLKTLFERYDRQRNSEAGLPATLASRNKFRHYPSSG